MDDKVLNAEKREQTGKGATGRLRKTGMIPAVIYGKNAPVHISLNAREFSGKVKSISESGLLTIKMGKKNFSVLVKDFQDDPISKDIYHLDFFEITKGEKLHTVVPITVINAQSSEGIKLGGLLEQVLHEVDIECLPKNIPEHIECDVQSLNLNESFHVSQLELPEGVKVLTDSDRTIVTITTVKVQEETTEDEEASVEVIGEDKGEEGE